MFLFALETARHHSVVQIFIAILLGPCFSCRRLGLSINFFVKIPKNEDV